jgi:putative transposase
MSRPRRLQAFDYRGAFAYSLTFCAFRRTRHFEVEATFHAVRDEILRTADERDFAVLAYCFMPDHLHLLIQGQDAQSSLQPFAKLARQRATKATAGTRRGPLWQDGYHERTLRRDEHVLALATYIVSNPVRAGLAKTWTEWPGTGGTLVDAMRTGTDGT